MKSLGLIGSFVTLETDDVSQQYFYILSCSPFLFHYCLHDIPVDQAFPDPHLAKGKGLWIRQWWARQSKGRAMKRMYCWVGFPQMILCHCWLIILLLGTVHLQRRENLLHFLRTIEATVHLVYNKARLQGNITTPFKCGAHSLHSRSVMVLHVNICSKICPLIYFWH